MGTKAVANIASAAHRPATAPARTERVIASSARFLVEDWTSAPVPTQGWNATGMPTVRPGLSVTGPSRAASSLLRIPGAEVRRMATRDMEVQELGRTAGRRWPELVRELAALDVFPDRIVSVYLDV